MRVLAGYIDHLQFVRTPKVDPNGYGKNKIEAVKEWKPADPHMTEAFEYMKQLLNDTLLSIEQRRENVWSFALCGRDKVEEMEVFIYEEK